MSASSVIKTSPLKLPKYFLRFLSSRPDKTLGNDKNFENSFITIAAINTISPMPNIIKYARGLGNPALIYINMP